MGKMFQTPSANRVIRACVLVLLLVLLAYSALIYGITPSTLTPQTQPKPKAPATYRGLPGRKPNGSFLIPEDRHEAMKMEHHLKLHPHILRAAICILVQSRRFAQLRNGLHALYKNFNHRFRYPVLVFHEQEFLAHREQLRKSQPNPMFFQMIRFQLPDLYEKRFGSPEVVQICPWSGSLGYRHMCYFFSKAFFEQPALSALEYYWRLDDDSLLAGELNTDPFSVLHKTGADYGYLETVLDSNLYTYNLWNITRQFISERGLQPTFFRGLPEHLVFFNNFEVARLSFWWSPEFRSFIDVISEHAGSFRYRWGDGPIRTLALSIFVRPEKIVRYTGVEYQHGNPQIPPRLRLPILEQLSISTKGSAG